MMTPIRLIALAAAGLTLAGCATAQPHYDPHGYGPSRYSDRGDCGGCGAYHQGGYGYEYGQDYGYGYGYPSGPGPAPWQQNTALRPHHAEGGYVGYGYAPVVSAYSSSYSSSAGYAYGSAYGGGYAGYPVRATRYCEQHRIYDWHDGH